MTNPLTTLKKHSARVGADSDLVQASGGNTSWKSDRKIVVKGSGKRLKDAESEDIFASINYESLSEGEILDCQDFSQLTSNLIVPSIETNFHIFLKDSFVTHLHSLGAIAIGVTPRNLINKTIRKEIQFVPYARPGVDLVKAIKKTQNYAEKILVLENHGVIFSGQVCSEIEFEIQEFEAMIREYFANLPRSNSFPDWIEILISGILTPDEVVFLGEKPFVKSEFVLTDSVGIDSLGELIFPANFSDDRVEVAKFYKRVAILIEKKTFINYLPAMEVIELLGWDKEKRRIRMSK